MFVLFINNHWLVSITIVFLLPRGLAQKSFKGILYGGGQIAPNFVPFCGRRGNIGVLEGELRG